MAFQPYLRRYTRPSALAGTAKGSKLARPSSTISTVVVAASKVLPGKRSARDNIDTATAATLAALRPYRQGQLDGLCGLYATINALRLATQSQGKGDAYWRDIFNDLVEATEGQVGIEAAIVEGIGRKQLIKILSAFAKRVRRSHDMHLQVERIEFDHDRRAPRSVLQHLGDRVNNGSPLLIELRGSLSHWTVLRKVGGLKVDLFDSFGMRDIRRTRFAAGHHANASMLEVRSAFLLTLTHASDPE